MDNFTPYSALIGGILIGLASAGLLYTNGRIAGISGIFGGMLHAIKQDTLWRLMFVAGLLVGGLILSLFYPSALDIQVDRSAAAVMLAGLLVGIGARMGSGCTSGHGVCGLSRLAPRSIAATLTFVTTGIIVATLVSRAGGLI